MHRSCSRRCIAGSRSLLLNLLANIGHNPTYIWRRRSRLYRCTYPTRRSARWWGRCGGRTWSHTTWRRTWSTYWRGSWRTWLIHWRRWGVVWSGTLGPCGPRAPWRHRSIAIHPHWGIFLGCGDITRCPGSRTGDYRIYFVIITHWWHRDGNSRWRITPWCRHR